MRKPRLGLLRRRAAWEVLGRSGISRVVGRRYAGLGSVFAFHRVAPAHSAGADPDLTVTSVLLEAYLRSLRRAGVEVISSGEAVERLGAPPSARPFVVIHFDDGYRDTLRCALPLLEAFGAPFTVFPATTLVENRGASWWIGLDRLVRTRETVEVAPMERRFDTSSARRKARAGRTVSEWVRADLPHRAPQLRAVFDRYRISVSAAEAEAGLSRDELRALARHPLATVGGHTTSHPDLTALEVSAASREIRENRIWLETLCERPVAHFTFPYGRGGEREARLAAEAGFTTAFTTTGGGLFPEHRDRLLFLPRHPVAGSRTTLRSLEAERRGVRRFLESRAGSPLVILPRADSPPPDSGPDAAVPTGRSLRRRAEGSVPSRPMASAAENGRRPAKQSSPEPAVPADGTRSPRTSAAPRPNRVRYNDWRQVAVEPLRSFVPTLPVSVVVPCYRPAPGILERTLAALESQTYPRDLFEVVLVDDGSEPPLRPPGGTPFPLRLARQERRGFGLARARNLGAEAARHDLLLFLDCDLLVEARWIAAHARWHHRLSDVVTVGRCADVSPEGLDPDRIRSRTGPVADFFSDQRPRPGAEHLLRTNDLTSRADDPFRALLGGNFGVGREFYRSVGGHDESFRRWGMEEIEFGYRAHTRGALFAPVPEAFAFHQGTAAGPERERRERQLRFNRAKCAHLIAHRGIRGRQPGRTFAAPQLVVTLTAGPPAPPPPPPPPPPPDKNRRKRWTGCWRPWRRSWPTGCRISWSAWRSRKRRRKSGRPGCGRCSAPTPGWSSRGIARRSTTFRPLLSISGFLRPCGNAGSGRTWSAACSENREPPSRWSRRSREAPPCV